MSDTEDQRDDGGLIDHLTGYFSGTPDTDENKPLLPETSSSPRVESNDFTETTDVKMTPTDTISLSPKTDFGPTIERLERDLKEDVKKLDKRISTAEEILKEKGTGSLVSGTSETSEPYDSRDQRPSNDGCFKDGKEITI